MTGAPANATEIIRAHTRPIAVPNLPISLWQADQLTPIWEATQADLTRHDMGPPFWAFAWAGGQAIARYVLDHPGLVVGKRVLDLAAGSGLIAIAALKAGAGSALANDTDPWCGPAIALNATLNGVEVEWSGADLLEAPLPDVDMILAGDVFYEFAMAQRFLAFFRRAEQSGVLVLAGDPDRSYFPREDFEPVAEYAIEPVAEIESANVTRTRVWRLARRGAASGP
jgi:predicted nicotinamide N-methyase